MLAAKRFLQHTGAGVAYQGNLQTLYIEKVFSAFGTGGCEDFGASCQGGSFRSLKGKPKIP